MTSPYEFPLWGLISFQATRPPATAWPTNHRSSSAECWGKRTKHNRSSPLKFATSAKCPSDNTHMFSRRRYQESIRYTNKAEHCHTQKHIALEWTMTKTFGLLDCLPTRWQRRRRSLRRRQQEIDTTTCLVSTPITTLTWHSLTWITSNRNTAVFFPKCLMPLLVTVRECKFQKQKVEGNFS